MVASGVGSERLHGSNGPLRPLAGAGRSRWAIRYRRGQSSHVLSRVGVHGYSRRGMPSRTGWLVSANTG